MVNEQDIKQLLKYHFLIKGYVWIDPHSGQVDVQGDVQLRPPLKVNELPIQFGTVKGDFLCFINQLTTLKGAPHTVHGAFDCSYNQLTSLQHAPVTVGRWFDCTHNKLSSLLGAPAHVPENFECGDNFLKDLTHAPEHVGGTFVCDYSANLPLLRLLSYADTDVHGAPDAVDHILHDPEWKGKGKLVAIKAAIALTKAGFKGNARW
jgi:hypothetical protein